LVGDRLAAGDSPRGARKAFSDLARVCISAYGDALVPRIAEAIGLEMPALVAELRADRLAQELAGRAPFEFDRLLAEALLTVAAA
jgi:hypothetical protein